MTSTTTSSTFPGVRPALFVGHPGHELRVHRWMELARPIVFVLTDGSGHSRNSRLQFTLDIIRDSGATVGGIMGRFTDRFVYDSLLKKEHRPFIDLAAELGAFMANQKIDYVVSDACEGYNPTHDVCRLLTQTALKHLRAHGMKPAQCFHIPVVGQPDLRPVEGDDVSRDPVHVPLLPTDLERKLSAARRYTPLAEEVERTIHQFGETSLANESIFPAKAHFIDAPVKAQPYYETYGRQQVDRGLYSSVVEFEKHMRPLIRSLRDSA